MPLAIAASACVFLAVVFASLALLQRRSGPVDHGLEQRLRALNRPAGPMTVEGRRLLTRDSGTFPFLRLLMSRDIALDLQQAGLRLKVSEYMLIRFFAGAIAAVAIALLLGSGGVMILVAAGAAVAGYMTPEIYVRIRRDRRIASINRQLVEALALISNALRSGFAFTQAIELAAKQLSPPLQDEFNSYLRDSNLGARAEDALNAMVERSGSLDLEMVVTSILIQRVTGGNLSEVLDNVAETIRERDRLRGEIRALTAQQRLTGNILSVYPTALAGLFFVISPDLMSLLWEEEAGIALLAIALTLQAIGIFSIRRILAIDI